MRSLASALILLILLHVLGAVGFVGYLAATDRLSQERIDAAVELFTPTVREQAEREAEVEAATAQAEAARDQLMRLERVADGPQSVEERLQENFEADEVSLHRLERLKAETEAIRRRLDQDKALLERQTAELEAEREAFEATVDERAGQMQDEDFARAVKTLEQLPARQAKEVVQQILGQGKLDVAVDYLAAMQLRKSAGVLKAFKTEAEVAQVTRLIEELRLRGVDPIGGNL